MSKFHYECWRYLAYLKNIDAFNQVLYGRGETMNEQPECIPLGQGAKCIEKECGQWSNGCCIYYKKDCQRPE